MTLTVPVAGTDAGRAARPISEPSDTGNVIAAFGQNMMQVGTRLENDRLDREMGRLQVDMTKDLNDLRLQAEEIGDPDQLDQFWASGVNALKQSYLTGQNENGRARVDPKIRDKWELGFDDLTNRHAFAIGQNSLALRQSQRLATFADYEHVAGQQAALTDPGTRDALYATYDEQVDKLQAQGLLSPEAAGAKKRDFRANTESANLTALVGEDPEAVLEGLDAGIWPGLSAQDQATWSNRAKAAISTRDEKAARQAEAAAKEASAKTAADLRTGIAVAGKGQFSAYDKLADDPAVIAAHPDLAAELKGAIALRDEGKNIAAMALPDLRKLSADLGKRELTADWQVKQKEAVDRQIALSEKAFGDGGDQIAYARDAGLPVPELDVAGDGESLAKGLAARASYGAWLVDKGYTDAPSLLSEAERNQLAERIDEKADPAGRVGTVLALTKSLGPDGALRLAAGAKASPGFNRAIGLVADGADPSTVLPMLRGEQKLAEKVASAPPAKQAQMVFNEITGTTLDGSVPTMSEIYQGAAAIFADGMGETDPEEMANGLVVDGPARTKWVSAIQQAAGASPDRNGQMTVGGFQEVAGQTLLLPRNVSAEAANRAVAGVAAELAGGPIREVSRPQPARPVNGFMDVTGEPGPLPKGKLPAPDIYRGLKAASLKKGAFPDLGDDPSAAWDALRIERVEGPVGQDAYVLVGERRGVPYYVEDADGQTYAFSLDRLTREAR